jgi:hypothetical protein
VAKELISKFVKGKDGLLASARRSAEVGGGSRRRRTRVLGRRREGRSTRRDRSRMELGRKGEAHGANVGGTRCKRVRRLRRSTLSTTPVASTRSKRTPELLVKLRIHPRRKQS